MPFRRRRHGLLALPVGEAVLSHQLQQHLGDGDRRFVRIPLRGRYCHPFHRGVGRKDLRCGGHRWLRLLRLVTLLFGGEHNLGDDPRECGQHRRRRVWKLLESRVGSTPQQYDCHTESDLQWLHLAEGGEYPQRGEDDRSWCIRRLCAAGGGATRGAHHHRPICLFRLANHFYHHPLQRDNNRERCIRLVQVAERGLL